jgi:hypothetical protein
MSQKLSERYKEKYGLHRLMDNTATPDFVRIVELETMITCHKRFVSHLDNSKMQSELTEDLIIIYTNELNTLELKHFPKEGEKE